MLPPAGGGGGGGLLPPLPPLLLRRRRLGLGPDLRLGSADAVASLAASGAEEEMANFVTPEAALPDLVSAPALPRANAPPNAAAARATMMISRAGVMGR